MLWGLRGAKQRSEEDVRMNVCVRTKQARVRREPTMRIDGGFD